VLLGEDELLRSPLVSDGAVRADSGWRADGYAGADSDGRATDSDGRATDSDEHAKADEHEPTSTDAPTSTPTDTPEPSATATVFSPLPTDSPLPTPTMTSPLVPTPGPGDGIDLPWCLGSLGLVGAVGGGMLMLGLSHKMRRRDD